MIDSSLSLILDCGGHGCTALLIDGQAETVAEAFKPVATRVQDNRVEQDAEAVLEAMQGAIAALPSQPGTRIDSAALGVQRGNVLCWSAGTGRALSPVLSWRDRRSVGSMPKGLDPAQIQDRTGLRVSPYAGAAKLAWCLDNLPDVQRAQDQGELRCGPLGAWLARQLGGADDGVDDSLAQRTLLWSRRSRDWDPELCRSFGIALGTLPPVHACEHDWGLIHACDQRVPLALVCGDQNVLPWLDGGPDPATLSINLGTGGFLVRPLAAPRAVPEFQLSILDRNDGGRYAMEGSVHGVASALDWLFQREDRKIEHQQLDALAAAVSSPPLFLNTVDGLGSPWWEAGPDTGFVTISGQSEPGFDAKLRALLESMAFLIRVNVEAMNRYAPKPDQIRLSGGLAGSSLLCQLIAAMLAMPVSKLVSGEGTALGLWGRLRGQAVPGKQFDPVDPVDFPGLQDRYRQWCERMPGR
ncbi:MAG: hypothetical protein EA370_14635 [Wenzhouxiangella sp.]|nr:MAG: hypothetical protein EA370_14635 [Wenzhouxiangella sp.]